MIPYGQQDITQEDIESVVNTLKSDFLTQGPQVPNFEEALCQYTKAKCALAVNSATSALHVACMALDLGQGDWLWTSPISFIASSNCALYCGAKVDFVDIDPQTYNLSVSALKEKLLIAKRENKLPKVVVPVHLCGQSCEMSEIYALAQEYGFKIIEDASHAIGAKYKGEPVGNCQYSDIVVFSFHPVKIITTAEGGVAMTNQEELAEKMALFRCHGMTRDERQMQGNRHGDWYYQQIGLGYNYRMTELQAALGVSQIKRLDEYVQKRQYLAKQYDKALADLSLTLPFQHPDTYSSYHLYPILTSSEAERKVLFDNLRSDGVGVNVHYIPIHTQPYYQKFGFKCGYLPVAEDYYRRTISLPLFAHMTSEQHLYIIDKLRARLI